ncbi:MAG: polyphosphate polymerase domain-containing protein [Deltaproteobacteria bacterium]|nr:polyphosphate polymerase domain-containing protein [Deltaproteobacteria bacterium]
MSDLAIQLDGEAIDARMTADRREAKYLLSPAQARAVTAAVHQHLVVHRHRGDGANTLPGAHHFVTTIYFDTPSRALFRAAHDSADSHIKLRAKEYYDLHPDLTETATDARQLVRFQPILWLELKHREGANTGKRRIGIPKRDVPAFFAEATITPEMVRIQEQAYGKDARAVLAAVAELCASCAEPMRADCLVNYRRLAWQDPAGELRVTIDSGLAFYAPPTDLWDRDWALLRQTLGPAVGAEPRRVLEVKSHRDPPAWLTRVLETERAVPLGYSKFDAGSSAVHG